MNRKDKIYFGLGFFLAMSAVGCQEDDTDEATVNEYPVELLIGMKNREEVTLATRALPEGYSASDFTSDPGKIGVFMTQANAGEYTYPTISGTYKWVSHDTWKSGVTVKYDPEDPTATDNDYYVYGFLPVLDGIGATITSTDFKTGAVMKLANVPPTSAQDLCIITGVRNGVKDGAKYKAIGDVDMKVGKYDFTASTDNAVYMLFDHVYSKMTMKMKVDSIYSTLRTIKVLKMTMTGSAPSVDVEVTYLNNGTAPSTTITPQTGSTPISSVLLSSETALNTKLLDLTSFYCADVLSSVTLTTTFDVYDKNGNKMRSACETSNTLSLRKLEAGKAYIIEATIKPTYLYQLGEDDLDKPTVSLN